jgi:hypothetical protein
MSFGGVARAFLGIKLRTLCSGYDMTLSGTRIWHLPGKLPILIYKLSLSLLCTSDNSALMFFLSDLLSTRFSPMWQPQFKLYWHTNSSKVSFSELGVQPKRCAWKNIRSGRARWSTANKRSTMDLKMGTAGNYMWHCCLIVWGLESRCLTHRVHNEFAEGCQILVVWYPFSNIYLL